MVYDNVEGTPRWPGERGFAIHKAEEDGTHNPHPFEVYTDDGRGNGDFIAACYDYNTALRIAYALDLTREKLERQA